MNGPSEGKHFKLVKDENLRELLLHVESYLPESLKLHQTLKTYLEDHVWNFSFYVSKNWPNDPICLHFPGVTKDVNRNEEKFSSLCLFCPINRVDCLNLFYKEDVLIDWTKPIYIHYTHSVLMDEIELMYRNVGIIQNKCYGDFYIHYTPDNLSLSPPRFDGMNVEFRMLEKKDADVIHYFYPANDIESEILFEKLIERLPSFGIFVNNELAAWMIQSYYGAMISMYTKPRFRLLGFGGYVAKYLSKLVASRGYMPYVLVRSNNKISKKLYENLGFTRLYTNVRGMLTPHKRINNDVNEIPEI